MCSFVRPRSKQALVDGRVVVMLMVVLVVMLMVLVVVPCPAE